MPNRADRSPLSKNGAVIGVGPAASRAVSDKLISLAKAKEIPFQIEAMGGWSGTDADEIQTAREGVAAGVVVGQDHPDGLLPQRVIDDLADRDADEGAGALAQDLAGEHMEAAVETEHDQALLRLVEEHRQEIVSNLLRVAEHLASLPEGLEIAAVQLPHQADQRGGARPNAVHRQQFLVLRLHQPFQAAEAVQQPVRERIRVAAREGVVEQQLHGLDIREGVQPVLRELLLLPFPVPGMNVLRFQGGCSLLSRGCQP